jgi:8-oxo-dGTP pyrophosphatase MutT (NUDIX family)
MTEQIKLAACVLLYSPEKNQILAVSRKNNPNDFGLPGGKIEENEDATSAAIRELYEETGYKADELTTFFIYKVKGETDYLTTTFLPRCDVKDLDKVISSWKVGSPLNGETGVVKWVNPEILVESSSFSSYNLKLLRLLWATKYVHFNIDEILGMDEVDFEVSRVPNFRNSFKG